MESNSKFMSLTLDTRILAVALILAAPSSAYALHMNKIAKERQTTILEPRRRRISLKLPLRQPVFHWTFQSKEDLLAGKLTLRISRDGKTTEIVVFENGHMSEGWEPMTMPDNPKAAEIYFGFQSSKKYATAPNDKLEIELYVKEDLDGIGALHTGILPAGTYKAQGSYSGLLDEFKVSGRLKNTPKETVNKLRKAYEFKAFLENWKSQWSLTITGDEGWLSGKERQQAKRMRERMLELMRKDDEARKKRPNK